MELTQFWKQERNSEADGDAEITAARQIEETYAMKNILAAKYEPVQLTKVINEQVHLIIPERLALGKVLKVHLEIFQGLQGN